MLGYTSVVLAAALGSPPAKIAAFGPELPRAELTRKKPPPYH